MVDLLLAWFVVVGVWPFADPGHAGNTLGSAIDLIVHYAAVALFFSRWKLVRR